MLIRFLLTALLFLSCAPAWAEDIYIAQTAAGADTGANCANAHSAAWFNTAGNWGGGAGEIDPGDTAHLCGTISTQLTVQASGTVGNLITIRFEDGAKLSKASWNGAALVSNKDYIVIDGGTNGIIENTDTGTAGSYTYQDNAQGIWADPCNHCEIKNLTVQNIYIRTSATDSTPSWSQSVCMWLAGTDFKIHHNVCHDSAGGVIFSYNDGDTGVYYYNNESYHNSHNFVFSGAGGTHAGNVYYYNNYVHDLDTWDMAGCGPYHHSAIHSYSIGTPKAIVDQFWIYNNKWERPGACPTGWVFLEPSTSTIAGFPQGLHRIRLSIYVRLQ